MPFCAIVILDSAINFLWVVFFLSLLGLSGIFFHQFLYPILKKDRSSNEYPVRVGDEYIIVVDELSRVFNFSIGKLTGNLPTRCIAISDDHLSFQFKKNRESEEYDIFINRNSPVLFKAPRTQNFIKMDSTEKLESYELIGKNAEFRISDKIAKDRMINYIELTLGSSFFFTKLGKERMRFIINVTKIHPGLNTRVQSKDETYNWGKGDDTEEISEDEDSED
ncbi:MAG: hypothetical protein L6Q54_04920 [Leptospiraceae bacterium]|nr:hypothetical protein [Leptospiraceae bacterium]MCK6380579.1 hypothetical protein [Leptospiraceae bacterium]NUM40340.1 hypothetical protein [Leptospiraceae bacterium]